MHVPICYPLNMLNFLTPTNFEKFANRFSGLLNIALLATFIIGLGLIFFSSPDDYQQGALVKIMYVHVPAAWMAMGCYFLIGMMGLGFLVWRNPFCYVIGRAAAPIGATFAAICLATGSIWGYPTWGTWWVWDARLTSMLILFFLYLGYIALGGAFTSYEKEAKSASILALVGLINLPIIKYSVEWWNSLHQPASVFRIDGPTIHSSMLTPLLVMAVAFGLLFLVILINRIRCHLLEKKLGK